jgi:hypothetical protein
LFNPDNSAKPVAVALHDLTSILNGNAGNANLTTASLNPTFSGLPATGADLILQKPNGAYDIVVWAEPQIWNAAKGVEVGAPTETVTVNLGHLFQNVSIFDPMVSASPTKTLHNVQTVQIQVTDHPVIIEVSGASVAAPLAPSAPTGTSGSVQPVPPVGAGASYDVTRPSWQDAFDSKGAEMARGIDNRDGTGAITIVGADRSVDVGAGSISVSDLLGSYTFATHAFEAIRAPVGDDERLKFSSGFGDVSVSGFGPAGAGQNRLDLTALFDSFQSLGAHEQVSGNNTVITDAAGDSLTLQGVAPGALTAARTGFLST